MLAIELLRESMDIEGLKFCLVEDTIKVSCPRLSHTDLTELVGELNTAIKPVLDRRTKALQEQAVDSMRRPDFSTHQKHLKREGYRFITRDDDGRCDLWNVHPVRNTSKERWEAGKSDSHDGSASQTYTTFDWGGLAWFDCIYEVKV